MARYALQILPSDVRQQLADNHKKLRKQQGYTQTDLAERSGVSLGSLKRFEQTGQVSLANLLRLAHVLGRLSDFEKIFHSAADMKEVERLFSDEMRGA